MQDIKRINTKLVNQFKKGKKEPDFFYLLRLIENIHPNLPRIGQASMPDDESVRFGQKPYLNFPDSAIASIVETHNHTEDLTVLVYFFGLLGVNGPLPLETTSQIHQRSLHLYDNAPRRFLDIINHRLISLFYRAFAKNELPVNFDRSDGEIQKLIGALSSVNRKTIKDKFLPLNIISFLANRNRSKDGLERVLRYYLDTNLTVHDFVESKVNIPNEFRMRLSDRETSVLGVNCQIGSYFYTKSKSFSIEIGPISFEESFKYMPGQVYFNALLEIIRIYTTRPMAFNLVLRIDAKTIKGVVLGQGFALGQSTHLVSKNLNNTETVVKISVPMNATNSRKNKL